jgi:hypothetical protein
MSATPFQPAKKPLAAESAALPQSPEIASNPL